MAPTGRKPIGCIPTIVIMSVDSQKESGINALKNRGETAATAKWSKTFVKWYPGAQR